MENLKLLHIGCGNRYHSGFINADRYSYSRQGNEYGLDLIMNLAQRWPFEDESVDGIVSMHVLQQLQWRELIFALKESYRVLKKGGVHRFGCPSVELKEFDLDYILGWDNVNLFSRDLLFRVFKDRVGYSSFRERGYGMSALPELTRVDNRQNKCSKYFEAIK